MSDASVEIVYFSGLTYADRIEKQLESIGRTRLSTQKRINSSSTATAARRIPFTVQVLRASTDDAE